MSLARSLAIVAQWLAPRSSSLDGHVPQLASPGRTRLSSGRGGSHGLKIATESLLEGPERKCALFVHLLILEIRGRPSIAMTAEMPGFSDLAEGPLTVPTVRRHVVILVVKCSVRAGTVLC